MDCPICGKHFEIYEAPGAFESNLLNEIYHKMDYSNHLLEHIALQLGSVKKSDK